MATCLPLSNAASDGVSAVQLTSFPSHPEAHVAVLQEVDHGEEPAARRELELLQKNADHDWADNVQHLKLASKNEALSGPGLILSANVDEEAISGPCNQCVQLHSALQQYVEWSLAVCIWITCGPCIILSSSTVCYRKRK